MSGEYENPVKVRVSFNQPEPTVVVLQGAALDAYFEWQESGDDGDYHYFLDELHNQLEDHIVTYTMLRDVDPAR